MNMTIDMHYINLARNEQIVKTEKKLVQNYNI